MPILLTENKINIVRLNIALDDFPRLLEEHLKSDPTTLEVEKFGKNYVEHGFTLHETENFVKKVCHWGKYDGVAGKVIKNNETEFIRSQLRKAHSASAVNDPGTSIREVTKINGFGVSFGSKQLKFMNPGTAVVLDKIISERLGYPREPDGYVEFLKDCAKIRDILNDHYIVASPGRPTWRVSDVEMAIFMKVKS